MLLVLELKVSFGLGILFCVCLWLSCIVIVFKQRYQEHTRYLKHSDPQSAYALHISNNKHEYGPINNTMTLLKHINKTTLLIPFEHLYIESRYHHKQLVPEQHIGECNPIFQLIHDLHNMSLPTILTDQYSNIIQPKTISTLILLATKRSWYVQHFTIM